MSAHKPNNLTLINIKNSEIKTKWSVDKTNISNIDENSVSTQENAIDGCGNIHVVWSEGREEDRYEEIYY